MAISQYKGISNTATTVESEYVVNTTSVALISNDASTGGGDLYISFGSSITEGNYAILKAGEQFTNLNIGADSIYVKSSTGSVDFRFFGLTGVSTIG